MDMSIEEVRRQIAVVEESKMADLSELNNMNLSYHRIEELEYSIEAAEEEIGEFKKYL